jgi:hypothetical protein
VVVEAQLAELERNLRVLFTRMWVTLQQQQQQQQQQNEERSM